MKKQNITKIISLSLCAALALGGMGAVAYAVSINNEDTTIEAEEETMQTIESQISQSVSQTALGNAQEETVYVLTSATGTADKIIVNDWLKDADGKDSYDQETIKKELPVDLKVSYKLDGKNITPGDLLGKSGKVTIRYDYSNKQTETVNIDGREETFYVPFTMVTGVLLDNDIFTNVEVTNAKMINDGNHTVVIGVALPGLEDDLALPLDKINLPDYVEINADVKDFEMGMTLTVATNDLFNRLELNEFDSEQDLDESLNKLTDAMAQLMDGSSQLYDGLVTLYEKSGELSEGVNKLANGSGELKKGAGDLDNGAAKLKDGAEKLYSGLSTLTSNNAQLNAGAKQVFETLLTTANTQIASSGLTVPAMTIENYATVLNTVIASLDDSTVYEQVLAQVTQAVEANRPYIESMVTAGVQEQVTANVTAAVRMNLEATVSGGDAAIVDAQMESEPIKQLIASKVAENMSSESVKTLIAQNTEAQVQKAISDNMAKAEVQEKLAQASEGVKTLISLKTSLDSYNVFYQGLQTYTAGVAQAASGAGELASGTKELKAGTGKLYAGSSELDNGLQNLKGNVPTLIDGIKQLKDGALQLSDGLQEFDKEGIQKMTDYVKENLEQVKSRLEATKDVSKHYKSFSDAPGREDETVKFIYRTDAIEK